METSNKVLMVGGLLLMAHHLFAYGVLFDVSDWIGHDWLGLVMYIAGGWLHVTNKSLEAL